MAWTFSPIYIFPWNSTPFPPRPRLRLNHQIRAKHLRSHRAQRVWETECEVLWDSRLYLLAAPIMVTESPAKASTELTPEPQHPFLFQPIAAHVPFSFLLLTLAVWISDFLCTDDYNWGTVLRHSDVPDTTQTLWGFIFLTAFIYSWGLTLPEIKLFFLTTKGDAHFCSLCTEIVQILGFYMFALYQWIL